MNLIPNWWEVLKSSYVVRGGLLLAFFDALVGSNFYGLLDKIGPQWLAVINAFFVAVLLPVLRSLAQDIPVTPEVKQAMLVRAESTPVK